MIRCLHSIDLGYRAAILGVWALILTSAAGCRDGDDDDATPWPTPAMVSSPTPGATPEAPQSPTPEDASSPTPVPGPNLEGPLPYDTLSEYHFFQGDMKALQPVPGVVPFEPVSPLYSDNAAKARFIVLPEGRQIHFEAEGRWTYPEGAILVKNFFFWTDYRDPALGRTLIETRLLILQDGVWSPQVYLWNEDQTEAELYVAGTFLTVSYVDQDGIEHIDQEYQVPNTNQCRSCHANGDTVFPLGPRTRQLNFEIEVDGSSINQLEYFQILTMFDAELPSTASLPALSNPRGDDDLDSRARSYLEANCAHCHQPGGAAAASGLVLSIDEEDPYAYGVCRSPVATGTASGGYDYDIAPGDPDSSIMVYRMESTDPEVKMPELGTLTTDPFGDSLIREWISGMDPASYPCSM